MKINIEPKIINSKLNYGDIILTDFNTYIITDKDSIVSLETGMLYTGEEFDTVTELIEQKLEEIILEIISSDNVILSRK